MACRSLHHPPDPALPGIRVGHPCRGFTLVELAVVVMLLGILTAMIIPEMRGSYRDAQLRAGSRELVDACAMASSRAVSFGQPHRVRIHPGTGEYQLERQVNRGPRPVFAPLRGERGVSGTLASGITARLRASPPAPSGGGRLDRRGGADPGIVGPPAPASVAEPSPAPAEEGEPELVFRPDGTALPVDVVLQDPDGHGLILRINPVTSRVRILPLRAT